MLDVVKECAQQVRGPVKHVPPGSTLERACSIGTGPPWEPPAGPCAGISGKEWGVVTVISKMPIPRMRWSSVARREQSHGSFPSICPAPSGFWKTSLFLYGYPKGGCLRSGPLLGHFSWSQGIVDYPKLRSIILSSAVLLES